MVELLIILACLIIGPRLFTALERAARQVNYLARKEALHQQTIRSLFAPYGKPFTGCAHYVRRRTDIKPITMHIERIDPEWGLLPHFMVAQAD